jgi:hypothetical protein
VGDEHGVAQRRVERGDRGVEREQRVDVVALQRHRATGWTGAVFRSRRASTRNACPRVCPHMAGDGRSEAHTAGRRGSPNNAQRRSPSSCTQGTPAGLPPGMPGIGVEIEGASQQAAQRGRQSTGRL